jgi:hypothetical protein
MSIKHFLILLILVSSCSSSNKSKTEAQARARMESLDIESQNNINALIEMIEDQRAASRSEKRFVPYEFRIPIASFTKDEVLRIDPSVRFTDRGDTYQCIGENATKEKVFRLVALSYTYKIKFCPFE